MRTSIFSKILFGAAVLGLGFLTSCGDKKSEETQAANETTTEAAGTETAEGKETAQLNPEHGLPGHRCDIPVGAPLSSATSMHTTPTSNNTVPTNVSPIRLDKTPAVNPPHGEPGHDCAVPVGAPLK